MNTKPVIIFILFSLLFLSCSSSPRFTSAEKTESSGSRYKKENRESEESVRKGETTAEKKRNSNALEVVSGVASYYSDKFHGRKTANGEIYDMHALTAAHENYPFGTVVKVRNLKNNKSVILRINDRKPDFNGRVIDISFKAAQELDMVINGIAHVQVEVLEWGK